MSDPTLTTAALVGGLAVGLIVHETCHGLACAWYGWPHTLLFAPPLIGGSRLRTVANGMIAACRIDDASYFREPARRRRRVALAPLLVSAPLLVALVFVEIPTSAAGVFLAMFVASTIPSMPDFRHAMIWHERALTEYQVNIGERCINHSHVEGHDVRAPW